MLFFKLLVRQFYFLPSHRHWDAGKLVKSHDSDYTTLTRNIQPLEFMLASLRRRLGAGGRRLRRLLPRRCHEQAPGAPHVPPSTSAATASQNNLTDGTCMACLELFPSSSIIRAPCGDPYCHDCLDALFSAATVDEASFPARCHGQEIPVTLVSAILAPRVLRKYKQRQVEWSSPDRTYCANTSCGRFLMPDANSKRSAKYLSCNNCGTSTCVDCKAKGHLGRGCKTEKADELLLETAKKKGWKRCGRCKNLIMKASGCNEMKYVTQISAKLNILTVTRCRCGHTFCYLCGKVWKTCPCGQFGFVAPTGPAVPPRRRRRLSPASPPRPRNSTPFANRHPEPNDDISLEDQQRIMQELRLLMEGARLDRLQQQTLARGAERRLQQQQTGLRRIGRPREQLEFDGYDTRTGGFTDGRWD
jgi:hypothetical protein